MDIKTCSCEAYKKRIAELEAAIDEQMVVTHLGVFNSGDDPKAALHKLMCWSEDVGAYFAKLEAQQAQAAQDVRNQALEEAAKICESRKPASREEFPEHWKAYEKVWGMREFFADECAMAIRAMKTTTDFKDVVTAAPSDGDE